MSHDWFRQRHATGREPWEKACGSARRSGSTGTTCALARASCGSWSRSSGKSREVPLHPSTVEALRRYGERRDQLCPEPNAEAFFLSATGTRLVYRSVVSVFQGLRSATYPARRGTLALSPPPLLSGR